MTAIVKTKIDDRGARLLLRRLVRNSENIRPALNDIMGDLLSSIDENFQKQGRPKRWTPLKPGSIRQRRKKQQSGTKILQASGLLASSINGKVQGDSKITIGSPLPYARIHDQGGTFTHPGGTKFKIVGPGKAKFVKNSATKFNGITKPHQITIPKRPFLMFQRKDLKEAEKVLADHLLSGVKQK